MPQDHRVKEEHANALAALQKSVAEFRSQKSHRQGAKSKASNSHTMRAPRHFEGLRLDLSERCRVLEIDAERRVAIVEPRVTMEQLVDATLPYSLIPPVVAEFKGITVGGAIMGTSLESSSHENGQFNDTCLAYVILLGDGTVVRATPKDHADLFYGISGSFGSLGVLISVEIRLVPTTGWLKLAYTRMESTQEAIQWMGKQARLLQPPQVIEGLAFDKTHVVVLTGRQEMFDQTHAAEPFSTSSPWSPWFYQVMRANTAGLAPGTIKEAWIPIKDYLFRYDRGAFWMGTYALHGSLLARFVLDNWGYTPEWLAKLSYDSYADLRDPGKLFRFLWGWACSSKILYTVLHWGSEGWFAKKSIIQDFYLPEAQAASFANQALEMSGITPLWLCPIKTANSGQFLAPHALEGELAFDVGVYGFSKGGLTPPELTQRLELLTHKLGGRKMLYSYTFFNEDEFWRVYSKAKYSELRRKYHAEGVWPNIIDKVLQQP